MDGANAVSVLFGFKAINAYNGWAISAVGVMIVFTGLLALSFLISQLHKVVALYENPSVIKKRFASKSESDAGKSDLKTAMALTRVQKLECRQYALLVRNMDEEICLPKLLRMAELSGLKDPHTSMNVLLKSGILSADGQGYFRWDEDVYNRTIS